jgi:HAD superfamily hydrolase (TIGR01509 family)
LSRVTNLIFDLDGTLIDSSDGVVEAVNFALTSLGETARQAADIKPYIGYPLHQMFADFTDLPADALYRQFQIRAADTVVASAVPLDGVELTLRELLRRGFRLSVATTKIRRHLDGIVKKLGWSDLFVATAAGNEVPKFKPDPAVFHLALDRLGARPESSLAVGDTENDILAARAVPMRVAAVLSPYGGHDRIYEHRPDYVIASLRELPALLDTIAG